VVGCVPGIIFLFFPNGSEMGGDESLTGGDPRF
jgi:hypothetical protein